MKIKNKKKFVGGGSVWGGLGEGSDGGSGGGVGLGGQGGCERRTKVFVKIQKKKRFLSFFFFFGGGWVGGGWM